MPAPISFTGIVTTPRIQGDASIDQNLFALENRIGSRKLVRVRRWSVQLDHTVALTAVKPQVKSSRVTGVVANGGRLEKLKFDPSQVSDPYVLVWYAAQFDGSLQTSIETVVGTALWQQFVNRMHSTAEQQSAEDANVLPRLVDEYDFRIYPGQYVVAQVRAAVATSNPATNWWTVQVVWTEEAFDTYTISGVVTLSGSPYVGAEIIVVIADDENLTNPLYWETVVSAAGGVWSSKIPVGKVAFAYGQDSAAGPTRYTAEGRPYLKQ